MPLWHSQEQLYMFMWCSFCFLAQYHPSINRIPGTLSMAGNVEFEYSWLYLLCLRIDIVYSHACSCYCSSLDRGGTQGLQVSSSHNIVCSKCWLLLWRYFYWTGQQIPSVVFETCKKWIDCQLMNTSVVILCYFIMSLCLFYRLLAVISVVKYHIFISFFFS